MLIDRIRKFELRIEELENQIKELKKIDYIDDMVVNTVGIILNYIERKLTNDEQIEFLSALSKLTISMIEIKTP